MAVNKTNPTNKIVLPPLISRTEGSILSKLWRNILVDTNMDNALDYLVTRYMSDHSNSTIKADKRKTKSSIIKNITADDMTWKTFLDILFNFLRVRRIEFCVKLTRASGDISVHSVIVDNPNIVNGGSKNVGSKNITSDKKE